MKMVPTYFQTQHHFFCYQSLSNVVSLWWWKPKYFLILANPTCFMDKNLVQQCKLALVEKDTLVLIEVIDGWNLSWRPITHETKPLNVTTGFHTSKVVFNVISFPINPIIIGLFWLVLHNPQEDWHTKNLHFETPQHEALECETPVKIMQNLK